MALRLLNVVIWLILACLVFAPVVIAALNPLLVSRETVYVIGGMSGVIALALLLIQPLLAAGYLPGLTVRQERRWHRWLGAGVIAAVALHIGGLYLTSPMDTMDALLLVAPTPFSAYGVIGMWAVVSTAILVVLRTRTGLRYATWRILHNALAVVIVVTTVVHALMIEGAMGNLSKLILCVCVVVATAIVVLHQRVLKPLLEKR